MEIIPLDPSKHQDAAKVLSAAFYNYPMFTSYFPDPKRRKRHLAWYLGNVLNCTLRYGEAYTTADHSGVMMLLPPEHTKITLLEYIQNGFCLAPIKLGLRNYFRSMRCEDYVAHMHQTLMEGIPHYYLWGLAVNPESAGQGIGKALMNDLLQKADAAKTPIYLETHAERNVAYYQKLGFTLLEKAEIPGCKLPFWCMKRDPETPND